MVIELPLDFEEQLRELADKKGRNVHALVEEAIRQYLEAAAINDLEVADVAETQVALAKELPDDVSAWKDPQG